MIKLIIRIFIFLFKMILFTYVTLLKQGSDGPAILVKYREIALFLK
jgi:hypothetical protein